MNDMERDDWRTLCKASGIDIAEVQMVAQRYTAYRDYMAGQGTAGKGDALTLEAWFRFYRLEKESESGAHGGMASGCSATGEAPEQNLLSSPRAFFDILRRRLESDPGASRKA
jgi:hypothetical protein